MPKNDSETPPSGIQEALLRALWSSQLRYVWIACLVFGTILFALWQTVPDAQKTKYLDRVFGTAAPEQEVDLEVLPFLLSKESDESAVWLKNKLERNLVELLSNANHRVSHKLSTNSPNSRARMSIAGTISRRDARYMVDVSLLENDIHVASTNLEADFSTFEEVYKSIPEAAMYGMDVDVSTLRGLSSRTRPTSSVLAYAHYLQARRLATAKKYDKAISLLEKAVVLDRDFAMAHWARGELYGLLGDDVAEKKWKTKAQAIDPDHPRLPIYSKAANPMPAIILAAKETDWREVDDGFRVQKIHVSDYGISIFAWSFDPALFDLEVVSQLEETGSTVREIRERGKFLLVVNGGFFEIDSKYRLSPSGLLVVKGQPLSPYRTTAGSGVLLVKDKTIKIDWSKDHIEPTGVTGAVQSNPLVVDPGGKNGILRNDFNRLDRSAICLTYNRVVLIVVKGGMSLFELGSILSSPVAQGGFGCERALNLDGGPSSQASFMFHKHSHEVEGVWRIQNALAVSAKTP